MRLNGCPQQAIHCCNFVSHSLAVSDQYTVLTNEAVACLELRDRFALELAVKRMMPDVKHNQAGECNCND